jgi:hypothetical protein
MKNKIKSGKRMKVLAAFLCVLSGMMIFTSPASSDVYKYSFMITVPVNVQKLSVYAKSVVLICEVKDQNGKFLTQDFSGASYSSNVGTLDSSGNFSGNLSYAIRLMNPGEASSAKTYKCSIQPSSGSSRTAFQNCDSDTAYFCLKPGASVTLETQGSIP